MQPQEAPLPRPAANRRHWIAMGVLLTITICLAAALTTTVVLSQSKACPPPPPPPPSPYPEISLRSLQVGNGNVTSLLAEIGAASNQTEPIHLTDMYCTPFYLGRPAGKAFRLEEKLLSPTQEVWSPLLAFDTMDPEQQESFTNDRNMGKLKVSIEVRSTISTGITLPFPGGQTGKGKWNCGYDLDRGRIGTVNVQIACDRVQVVGGE